MRFDDPRVALRFTLGYRISHLRCCFCFPRCPLRLVNTMSAIDLSIPLDVSEEAIVAPGREGAPLRVMFVITCMPVGGAETLLVNLVRKLDRDRFSSEL